VNDNSAGSGGAQEALIYGFETATSAITGTGQFPAQGSPNVLRKSATNDATPRAWVCFADNRTVYFFAASGDTASTYFGLMFGDFYSVCPGDQWNCMLIGSTTQNSGTNTTDTCTNAQIPTNAMTGHYIAQTYCGSNYGYITASKHGDAAKQGSTTNQLASNVTPLLTPNAGDGAYYVAPVWLCEAATGMVRGRLRGFWHLCHNCALFSDGALIQGVNDYVGRTFQLVRTLGSAGGALIEVSNSVETNATGV
jgi:hypothetical protein